jgi:hypothetical protein
MSLSINRRRSFIDAPAQPNQPAAQEHRVANARRIRLWHFRTDRTRAGPSRLHALFRRRLPQIMRSDAPADPPPYIISSQWRAVRPDVAMGSPRIALEIENFLAEHYRTKSGYRYHREAVNWSAYLSNSQNIVLCLRNPEGQICGMVASTQQQSLFGFSKQNASMTPYFVEFLCIHPMLRGRGLAGWLLGWLDSVTHTRRGPCVHFGWWFAPPPRTWSPLPSVTWMRLYSKDFTGQRLRAYEKQTVVEVPAVAAQQVVTEIITAQTQGETQIGDMKFDLYCLPTGKARWWRYQDEDLQGCGALVALVPTHWSNDRGQIWQVSYFSYVRCRPGNTSDISMPFWDFEEETEQYPRRAIEAVCVTAGLHTVLCSDVGSHYGHGLEPHAWRGWQRLPEISKLHIYNWMPSSFGMDSILWVAPTV